LEDGEDIEELAERTRDKKERRMQNKLLREESARGTPVSEGGDPRGRKKKGKAKANDYDTLPAGSKRKRGLKSETPSMIDDDDDEDNGGVCFFASFQVEMILIVL
jgi:ATP-dependent helicase STH1/SNF2